MKNGVWVVTVQERGTVDGGSVYFPKVLIHQTDAAGHLTGYVDEGGEGPLLNPTTSKAVAEQRARILAERYNAHLAIYAGGAGK